MKISEADYRLVYQLAMGMEPDDEMVEIRHHAEAALKWAADHPDFIKHPKLVQLHKKQQKDKKRLENQLRKDAQYRCVSLVGAKDSNTEEDRMLRKKHDLKLGEQVWTSPITGESVKGVRGESFKRKAEELAVRSGYVNHRDEMNW